MSLTFFKGPGPLPPIISRGLHLSDCSFLIRFRWAISGKCISEVMLCPFHWVIPVGSNAQIVLLLVLLSLVTWLGPCHLIFPSCRYLLSWVMNESTGSDILGRCDNLFTPIPSLLLIEVLHGWTTMVNYQSDLIYSTSYFSLSLFLPSSVLSYNWCI